MPRVPWHTPFSARTESLADPARGSSRSLSRPFLLPALWLASAYLLLACDSSRVPAPDVFVQLIPAAATVEVGATRQLRALVGNASDTAVIWRSSNPLAATVAQSGLVTGVAPGTAVIIAAAWVDTTRQATSTITVVPTPAPPAAVVRLEADTYAVSVAAPARFTAIVTLDGQPVAGAAVRWGSFYAVRSTNAPQYDVIWDRSLDPPVTFTDARGRATATSTIALESWSLLRVKLENGAADSSLVIATIPAESMPDVQWRALEPMPWTRAGMGAAARGGRIYILGGWCHGWQGAWDCGPVVYTPNPVATLQLMVFTPATGAWEQRAPPDSVALPDHGALAADLPDGIHLLAPGRHLLYLPETARWSVRTPAWPDTVPRPVVLAALEGRLYAIGETGELRIYDPAVDAWSLGARMPRAAGWGSTRAVGAVLGGQLYVAGGGGFFEEGRELTRYDPASDTWTARAPMPYGRSDMAAGAVAGRFCVFGGGIDYYIGSWFLRETYCYEPAANAWVLGPPPPPAGFATSGMAAVTLGDRVYVFGGAYRPYKDLPNTVASAGVLAPR